MPIDLEAAREFLASRYECADLAAVGAGSWSTAFAFTDGARRLVARFGRHVADYRKDARAADLFGEILPVPRVLEIGPAFDDHFFAISEWAPGDAIDALPEPRLREALPSLLSAIDRMTTAPLPADEGFGAWSAAGETPFVSWRDALLAIVEAPEHPRVRGWRAFLRSNPVWSNAFDAAAARLAALAEACPPGVRHLIHSDLTAGNVLVRGGRVSAVFDWGNSLIGDPLYDAAWLIFWSPWHPGLSPELVVRETRRRHLEAGLCIEAFDERLLACQLHIGLDNMAYNAFRQDAPHLEGTLGRLLPLVTRNPALPEEAAP